MDTYVILSKLSPAAFADPREFATLAKHVSEKIKEDCPGVVWKDSYATLGEYDVVDIVEAESPNEVAKAAMIIRAHGHATTATMLAIPWRKFLEIVKA